VPASVLLALGIGPLGGVSAPGTPAAGPDVYARAFVPVPAAVAIGKAPALTAAVQPAEDLGADGPLEIAPEGPRPRPAGAATSWHRSLEMLLTEWGLGLLAPADLWERAGAPQGLSAGKPDTPADDETAELSGSFSLSHAHAPTPGALAISLVFAGLAAGPPRRRRRAGRAARPGRMPPERGSPRATP